MAEGGSYDIQIPSVDKSACPRCGKVVDLREVPAFAAVTCPDCEAAFAAPGQLDQFILLKPLGKGQSSVTFKAFEPALSRNVALKVMRDSLISDRDLVADFLAEGRALASLDHPNVVRVYALGTSEQRPYLVMELLTGGALSRTISRHRVLEEGQALSIGIAVARALRAACEVGIIHGDVKPGNILLDDKGTAKLVDFGIARFGGGRFARGEAVGTPYYLSPEQVARESVDHRTDIYSLGATLYHALAGEPPFEGRNVQELIQARMEGPPGHLLKIRPALSPATAQTIMRMLQLDPRQRQATYDELLAELERAAAAVGKAATGEAKRRPGPKPGLDAPVDEDGIPLAAPAEIPHKRWLLVGAAAAVALVAVLAFVFWPGQKPAPANPAPGPGTPAQPAPPGTPDGRVATPVITPPGRAIAEPADVVIRCETPGAQVRYTTDGTDPTGQSNLVQGAIRIRPGTTLRATGFHDRLACSAVAVAVYDRDVRGVSGVIPIRTKANYEWDLLRQLDGAGGLKAHLDEARVLQASAEELYSKEAYAQAKTAYEKLLSACKELARRRDLRAKAQAAQAQAETALAGVADSAARRDPASPWRRARQAADQARAAFAKGHFPEAEKLWRSAAKDAGQQNQAVALRAKADYERIRASCDLAALRKAAPAEWKEITEALSAAEKAESDKRFDLAAKQYLLLADLFPAAQDAARSVQRLAGARELLRRARALMKEGRLLGADKAADEAQALAPGLDDLWQVRNRIQCRRQAKLQVHNNAGDAANVDLVWIPPGEFVFGTPPLGEAAHKKYAEVFRMKITRPFYMSETEITKKQFAQFAAEQGKDYKTAAERAGRAFAWDGMKWGLVKDRSWRKPGFDLRDNHPIVYVSWIEAKAYCDWAAKKTGATVDLPTEAQWEYACRAGTDTPYSFGDKEADLPRHGNYGDAKFFRGGRGDDGHQWTSPVKSYPANPWGLYDMHGNAMEWCRDWFGPVLPKSPMTDPTGPPRGTMRVVRGGSYGLPASHCRSDRRGSYKPLYPNASIGFRVVATGLPDKAFDFRRWRYMPPVPPEPQVHIADLPPARASSGKGKPQVNRSARNKPLTIGSDSYDKGVGVQSPSELVYTCTSAYKRFVAVLGIDAEVRNDGKTNFIGEVWADRKLLARSPNLRKDGPGRWHFDVPVPPRTKTIRLIVTQAQNGDKNDLADWVRAGFRTGE